MTFRVCFALIGLSVTACASPSVPMMGTLATEMHVGGHDFTVHHNGYRAEVVRTSRAFGVKRREMLARAATAIERASGCKIRQGTLYGDTVLAEALLACPDTPSAQVKPRWIYTPPE